jgi:hypothetical protein
MIKKVESRNSSCYLEKQLPKCKKLMVLAKMFCNKHLAQLNLLNLMMQIPYSLKKAYHCLNQQKKTCSKFGLPSSLAF